MCRRSWRVGVCALLLAAAGLLPAQTAPGRAAAVVLGVTITVEEVEAEMRLAPVALHLPEAQRRVRQLEALGGLIDGVLMRLFLDKEVGQLLPDALTRRMAELEAGLLKEQKKSLDEHCQETNQTMEQLRASVADQMRWSTYSAGRLSEEHLQKYYRENKAFFDKARVRASHIVLRVPASAGDADRAKVKFRLEELRKHLLADVNADFGALARQHSQDGHAEKGGDVGFFPRKWAFDEPFARAAFALPVNGLSEVVETEYGYHLIKVTARDEGTPSSYESAKEAVKAFCGEELRQEVLAGQRKRAAGSIKITLP